MNGSFESGVLEVWFVGNIKFLGCIPSHSELGGGREPWHREMQLNGLPNRKLKQDPLRAGLKSTWHHSSMVAHRVNNYLFITFYFTLRLCWKTCRDNTFVVAMQELSFTGGHAQGRIQIGSWEYWLRNIDFRCWMGCSIRCINILTWKIMSGCRNVNRDLKTPILDILIACKSFF